MRRRHTWERDFRSAVWKSRTASLDTACDRKILHRQAQATRFGINDHRHHLGAKGAREAGWRMKANEA
jgi:hypothetical protein